MSYKDLLLVLDAEPTARERIDLAAALAERFSAHLVGLYPLPTPQMPRHFGYYDPALIDPLFVELRERARSAAVKVREAFDHATGLRGLSGEWREIPEGPDADPALHLCRFGDPRPARSRSRRNGVDPAASGAGCARLRTASADRPLCRAFRQYRPAGLDRLERYPGSRARGQRRMPLLMSAELVTVLTIDPREGPHGHGELPGADIGLHLARHGVKAQIERTVSAGMPVGEVLLSRVADLGADLIVMGAYGHSRAREVLLGGATRSVLRSMTVPVLMSH